LQLIDYTVYIKHFVVNLLSIFNLEKVAINDMLPLKVADMMPLRS